MLSQKSITRAWRYQRIISQTGPGEIIIDVDHRYLIGRRILKRCHALVLCRVEQMDEEHVGVLVPVADVMKRQRRAGDRFTRQVDAGDAPRVGFMMIQIELVRSATAL